MSKLDISLDVQLNSVWTSKLDSSLVLAAFYNVAAVQLPLSVPFHKWWSTLMVCLYIMILLRAILRSSFSCKRLNFSSFFSLKICWRGLYPLFTGINPMLIELCLIGPGICISQKIGLGLVLEMPDLMIWWPIDHWLVLFGLELHFPS